MPGSLAMLAIDPQGKISGFVRTGNNTYTIGSKKEEMYAAYLTKVNDIANIADLTRCEMADEALYSPKGTKLASKHSASPLAATQSMTVAIDVDKAGYDHFGSEGEATNYITARFAAMSTVYEDEIDVSLTLGAIHIYTTPDPYTSANIDQLLQKFTSYWKINKGSVDRTIAHLISKQDLGGAGGASGLAWVAGLCDKDIGYGVTRIMGSDQFPAVDESVIAHEIGHNVGSHHTHNCEQYVPPIDSCVAAEGGCFAGTKQVNGTIMSYCNQKTFSFHPRTRTVMRDAVTNAPCLGTLAQIQVKLDDIVFPAIPVNGTKDTLLTALIKNTGTVPLTITSIRVENQDLDSEFYLKSLPTFPLVLQPNATQNVRVTFHPLAGGIRYGFLVIAHNAAGGLTTISLEGVGAEASPLFAIELDYGDITAAGNYDTSFVYVENLGDAPLTISKVTLSGVSASEFSIVSGQAPPNIVVPPDQTATIMVRFAPTSLGPKSARLDITHDAYDPPDNVDLIDLYANVVSLLAVHPGNRSMTASLAVSPNPTSEKLTIDITSNTIAACELTLVDQLGRTVAEIAKETLSANGLHTVWTIAPNIASGTYQLIAKIGESILSERVVILKK
jgi:hypothetical protein